MKQSSQTTDSSADIQRQEAKAVVDKLLLAVRNIAFYPQDHAVSQKSIADCHDYLKTYTEKYGAIALEVGKTSLFFQGEPIYQNPDLQSNLAYLCYRDGLEWISFAAGITHEEVLSFLSILKTQRMIEEEGKGDIITSLWEAGLVHIKYSASDSIWRNEPLLDFENLRVTGGQDEAAAAPEGPLPPRDPERAESMLARVRSDPDIIDLAPEEIEATRRLVSSEESRNFDLDVFDVLLVLLKEQKESEDFDTVLDIITESFKRTIRFGEFDYASRFLKQLGPIREAYKSSGTWAVAHLDDFLLMISSPRVLSGLKGGLARARLHDPGIKAALEEMLLQLAPESMITVAELLPSIPDPDLSEQLINVIRRQAEADLRPLIQMARQGSAQLRQSAVFIMGLITDRETIPILLKTARTDTPSLRRTAVKALTRYRPALYEQLLPFLKDSDEEIRKTVYNFLLQDAEAGIAQDRPAAGDPAGPRDTPSAVMEYLSRQTFSPADREFLLLLYEIAGRASRGAPPAYLSYQLLARPFRMGKIHRLHRVGAALALAHAGSPEADKTLARARKSIWPAIRRAVIQAEELLHARAA